MVHVHKTKGDDCPQYACVILAFISGGTKISSLALLAGALGTTSQVFFQFSLYCFKQYQLQSSLIEKLTQKEKIEVSVNLFSISFIILFIAVTIRPVFSENN